MALREEQTVHFTPLALWHIPHVLHIEHEAYPEPWTFNMLRKELENECSYFYLMYDNDVLVGYGGYWLILDEAHVTRITVASKVRGTGLSNLLMRHIMEDAKAKGAHCLRLEVRENNIAAIRLYEKFGFTTEGRRVGYYPRSKEDAVLMVKQLEGNLGNPGQE